jgi:hypothetical protein
MSNCKCHMKTRSKKVNDKDVKHLSVIRVLFIIGLLFFTLSSLQASAVSVAVQMDGISQTIKGLDGNPLPTGEVVQVIAASEETIHVPSQYGLASGGDVILWSGSVGQGGLGDGAFIRDFAGDQSLSDGRRIYVRAWNGPSLVLSDHYGDSQLSNTLEAGDPPIPLEWAVPSFEVTTIFTPEALSDFMQVVSVKINGVRFRSGDIISSRVSMEAVLSAEAGTSVNSVVLWVDNVPMYPALTLVAGSPSYGSWYTNFTIPPSSQQRHIFKFHMEDVSANACEVTMEARVMGGAVQVVGGVYNFPNPFSPMSGGATNIQYVLTRDANVTLIIYDITGHETKRMRFSSGLNGGRGGTNQVNWNGRSLGGDVAGNGMYLYKIISGDTVIGSGKLVVLD